MNRKEFQRLSSLRVKEAKSLLDQGHFAGAYYLAGYSVECAMKACIAKQTQRYDFPDKKFINDSYTHDLKRLLVTAGLGQAFATDESANDELARNWVIVKDWSQDTRYQYAVQDKVARDLYSAITSRKNGVLSWLKKRW